MLEVSRNIFTILAPFLLALVVAGVAANIAQVGFMFNFTLLAPDFSKLNPLRGLKKLISPKALIEVFKSIAKIAIICFVAYAAIIADMDSMGALIELPAVQIFQYTGQMVMKIGLYSALTLVLLAGIDYVYQRWEHEKNLRMTKQEVKDEIKQSEGDPIIKARIRAIQREIARRRKMDEH
jgi:flagellar biosynthetic protein FlhB